jgi:hypothetical protein
MPGPMPSLFGAARHAWTDLAATIQHHAPFEGAVVAATYVLLVLIASRYFLVRADRLKQPR